MFQRPSATRMFLLLLFLCNGDLLTNIRLGEIKNRQHGEWKNETWNIRWYSCFMSTYCILYLYYQKSRKLTYQYQCTGTTISQPATIFHAGPICKYNNDEMTSIHEIPPISRTLNFSLAFFLLNMTSSNLDIWTIDGQGAQSTSFSQGMPRLQAACSIAMPEHSPTFKWGEAHSCRMPQKKPSPTAFFIEPPLSSPLFSNSSGLVPLPRFRFRSILYHQSHPFRHSHHPFPPVAGSPHSLAFCFKVRCLHVIPPSQLFEHPWPKRKNIWGTTSALLRDLRDFRFYYGTIGLPWCSMLGVRESTNWKKPPKKREESNLFEGEAFKCASISKVAEPLQRYKCRIF